MHQKESPSAHVDNSAGVSSRKDKNVQRDNGAGNDSLERFVVAKQDKGSDKAPHTRSERMRRREASFPKVSEEIRRMRVNKDADTRKCVQEHNRTCEAMISLDKIANEHHAQMDTAVTAGAIWEPVECVSNSPRSPQPTRKTS